MSSQYLDLLIEGIVGGVVKAPFRAAGAVAKAPLKVAASPAKAAVDVVKAPFKRKPRPNPMKMREAVQRILEKWKEEVKIHSTGEYADKSVAQLKKQIHALKGKPGNKEKMGELLFALRAKQGWKKHTGV